VTERGWDVNIAGVGPGVAYYFMPLNLYLSGTLLLQRASLSESNDSRSSRALTDVGLAASLMVARTGGSRTIGHWELPPNSFSVQPKIATTNRTGPRRPLLSCSRPPTTDRTEPSPPPLLSLHQLLPPSRYPHLHGSPRVRISAPGSRAPPNISPRLSALALSQNHEW